MRYPSQYTRIGVELVVSESGRLGGWASKEDTVGEANTTTEGCERDKDPGRR